MRIGDDGAHLEVDAWLAASCVLGVDGVHDFTLETHEITDAHRKHKVDVAHLHEHWMTAGKELAVGVREFVGATKEESSEDASREVALLRLRDEHVFSHGLRRQDFVVPSRERGHLLVQARAFASLSNPIRAMLYEFVVEHGVALLLAKTPA